MAIGKYILRSRKTSKWSETVKDEPENFLVARHLKMNMYPCWSASVYWNIHIQHTGAVMWIKVGGYNYEGSKWHGIMIFYQLWSNQKDTYQDSKVHGAYMGPTWVLSAPDGPHVDPMNFAIRVSTLTVFDIHCILKYILYNRHSTGGSP